MKVFQRETQPRTAGGLTVNDITGPAGFGPARFVKGDSTLTYTIDFLNQPAAGLPVQRTVITQQLSSGLDWGTFQLGDIHFGSTGVPVPDGLTQYSTRVDARASIGLFVDVSAALDSGTGVVTWTFTAIDPNTNAVPANPAHAARRQRSRPQAARRPPRTAAAIMAGSSQPLPRPGTKGATTWIPP